jgi:AcrR family transcriptional regulator
MKGRGRRAGGAGSRERLFTAATAEFSARGFAGANVDRIADAARVNKAMLYYHFGSKASLYSEILRDMFGAVAARVADSAGRASSPADRILAMVEAIAREAEARPHFPSIWLREIAEGGRHVDKETMAVIGGILSRLAATVEEGVAAGRFAPAHPFLVQMGIVGPLLLYFATAPLRRKAPPPLAAAVQLTTEQVVAHVQRMTLQTLECSRSAGSEPGPVSRGRPRPPAAPAPHHDPANASRRPASRQRRRRSRDVAEGSEEGS